MTPCPERDSLAAEFEAALDQYAAQETQNDQRRNGTSWDAAATWTFSNLPGLRFSLIDQQRSRCDFGAECQPLTAQTIEVAGVWRVQLRLCWFSVKWSADALR
jgi:hypothetical protein